MKDTVVFQTPNKNRSFPLSIYLNDSCNELNSGRNFVFSHYHVDLEIIYMEEGAAVFHIDGTPVTVKAGQALFINSGQLHMGIPLNDTPCRAYAVVYEASLLSSHSEDYCQHRFLNA